MSIRREPTYLSTEVWKSLWLLAQSRSGKVDDQGLAKVMTADEMADTLLREVITEKYPLVFEHQKKVAKMDSELIKQLGAGVSKNKEEQK